MAQLATEVMNGTIFCLKTLKEEIELVSSTSAAVFIIDWENSMAKQQTHMNDVSNGNKLMPGFDFCDDMHAVHSKLSNQFYRNISIDVQRKLGSVSVQFIVPAILNEDKLKPETIASLCCSWYLEVHEGF